MGAFNTVRILGTCPSCKNEVNLEVQFKYGDVWQHHYQVGDVTQDKVKFTVNLGIYSQVLAKFYERLKGVESR